MQKIEEILNFIQSNRLNVSQTEREAGIKKGRMDKWLRGFGMPKLEDSEKLQNWYSKLNSNLEEVQKDAPVSDFKPQQGHDSAMDTIRNIAEGNKKIADANASLAKSNEELTSMVKQSVNVQSESLEVFGATLATLREFVLELCMKSKTHRSREEARAAFRIRLGEFLKNSKEVDIRSDLSK